MSGNPHKRMRRIILASAAGAVAVGGFLAAGTAARVKAAPAAPNPVLSGPHDPCSIFAGASTPCVAAYSTTRALYDSYTGPLYRVQRSTDGQSMDISPAAPGGPADGPAQAAFCTSACHITEIYDQSGHGSNLFVARANKHAIHGSIVKEDDHPALAAAAPVAVGAAHVPVYGVHIVAGTPAPVPGQPLPSVKTTGVGYRDDGTRGHRPLPSGDAPEGIYEVVAGQAPNYNGGCCFDFGNAEVHANDTGDGHMEALYYGTAASGPGEGPLVKADLENGLYPKHPEPKPESTPFLTVMLAGTHNHYVLFSGNANSGDLAVDYRGRRPSCVHNPKVYRCYNPMNKEGAVVLGIGGDNSDWATGTFYEGAVTDGSPAEATLQAVQNGIATWARYEQP